MRFLLGVLSLLFLLAAHCPPPKAGEQQCVGDYLAQFDGRDWAIIVDCKYLGRRCVLTTTKGIACR